ncbi:MULTISPECIES: hypothetical protein [Gammaproteobacteria]|uniref:hypothetical protein n=1 Tax=Gammaproteobacteria TaxID=1236 RepID=UPI001A9FEF0E|nr:MULTISPECIES: hypothetical protein [Gammaproteobacteria]
MNVKLISFLFTCLVLTACTSTQESPSQSQQSNTTPTITDSRTSSDPDYGYTSHKPIELGGFLRGTRSEGAHIDYFESLTGPNGEKVEVHRLGSCCGFEDDSLPFGGGLLDRYHLSYRGIPEPVVIYVNLYRFNKPMAPMGFLLE